MPKVKKTEILSFWICGRSWEHVKSTNYLNYLYWIFFEIVLSSWETTSTEQSDVTSIYF